MGGHNLTPCPPCNLEVQAVFTDRSIWQPDLRGKYNTFLKITFMRSIYKEYCNKYKSANMWNYFDSNWEICLQWIENESKTKSQTLVIAIGAWISPKCDWYFIFQIQRIVWNGDTWQYQTKLVSKIHNFSKLGSIFHFYSLIFRVSPW